jgi:antitoxin VapB
MANSTVFTNNRTQAVRLPAQTRFPDTVKKVAVRVVGAERIVAPIDATWDSFFNAELMPTDDFMSERASPEQAAREPLDSPQPKRELPRQR